MSQPIATFREFASSQDARTYRHENNTGGKIFTSTDDKPRLVLLFPPQMSPYAIYHHPMTAGRAGMILASA